MILTFTRFQDSKGDSPAAQLKPVWVKVLTAPFGPEENRNRMNDWTSAGDGCCWGVTKSPRPQLGFGEMRKWVTSCLCCGHTPRLGISDVNEACWKQRFEEMSSCKFGLVSSGFQVLAILIAGQPQRQVVPGARDSHWRQAVFTCFYAEKTIRWEGAAVHRPSQRPSTKDDGIEKLALDDWYISMH